MSQWRQTGPRVFANHLKKSAAPRLRLPSPGWVSRGKNSLAAVSFEPVVAKVTWRPVAHRWGHAGVKHHRSFLRSGRTRRGPDCGAGLGEGLGQACGGGEHRGGHSAGTRGLGRCWREGRLPGWEGRVGCSHWGCGGCSGSHPGGRASLGSSRSSPSAPLQAICWARVPVPEIAVTARDERGTNPESKRLEMCIEN